MKILTIALITGAVILGITTAEGNCTLALFLAVLLCPAIFERKVVRSNVGKSQR